MANFSAKIWLKEYRTNKLEDNTVHVRNITLAGTHNNNKMERLNEEIRSREKVTRKLKSETSPLLTGLQIFHNHVRPHMGREEKDPSRLGGDSGRRREQMADINPKCGKKALSTIENIHDAESERILYVGFQKQVD